MTFLIRPHTYNLPRDWEWCLCQTLWKPEMSWLMQIDRNVFFCLQQGRAVAVWRISIWEFGRLGMQASIYKITLLEDSIRLYPGSPLWNIGSACTLETNECFSSWIDRLTVEKGCKIHACAILPPIFLKKQFQFQSGSTKVENYPSYPPTPAICRGSAPEKKWLGCHRLWLHSGGSSLAATASRRLCRMHSGGSSLASTASRRLWWKFLAACWALSKNFSSGFRKRR